MPGRLPSHTPTWYGALPASPLGEIWIAVSAAGVVGISFWDEPRFLQLMQRNSGGEPQPDQQRVQAAVQEIDEYLQRQRRTFTLPIDWRVMTDFQEKVLRQVAAVPYGELRTYKDIAAAIGQPTAVRAVGRANATNPLPLLVPCHRILGADGRLHGFSAPGGVETKAWLLRLEGSWLL